MIRCHGLFVFWQKGQTKFHRVNHFHLFLNRDSVQCWFHCCPLRLVIHFHSFKIGEKWHIWVVLFSAFLVVNAHQQQHLWLTRNLHKGTHVSICPFITWCQQTFLPPTNVPHWSLCVFCSITRKITKYTDRNSRSSPTYKRRAAAPSANRENV